MSCILFFSAASGLFSFHSHYSFSSSQPKDFFSSVDLPGIRLDGASIRVWQGIHSGNAWKKVLKITLGLSGMWKGRAVLCPCGTMLQWGNMSADECGRLQHWGIVTEVCALCVPLGSEVVYFCVQAIKLKPSACIALCSVITVVYLSLKPAP